MSEYTKGQRIQITRGLQAGQQATVTLVSEMDGRIFADCDNGVEVRNLSPKAVKAI